MPRSRNIIMLLVSLLGAVLLWLYVVNNVATESTIRISSIPINIDGTIDLQDRDLLITSQDSASLTLELSGSRANLSKLNADSIRVNADASRIREPGNYALSCSVTFPDTVRPSDVEILRKSVENVNITVTKLKRKTLTVEFNWTGEVKEGYLFERDSTVIDPAEIELYGPDYEVDRITRAVVSYDISTLEEKTSVDLPVVFLNDENEEAELSESIEVSASEVRLTLPVLRTKEIRLALEMIPGGGVSTDNVSIAMTPETVRVKGDADVIDQLDDVYYLDSVELANLKNGETLSYDLSLPSGVTNISGEDTVTAEVSVTGISTEPIVVSDIRTVNAPEGLKVELSTRTVRVTIRGNTEEIQEIMSNADNGIYILVDLADYTQVGAYTVAGQVVNSTHPSVAAAENVQIGIVISAPEPTED